MTLGRSVMKMNLARLATAIAIVWMTGSQAMAQPAPAHSAAASGVPEAADPCASRPEVCKALRTANKALIDAARANLKGKYICTALEHDPACGTAPPHPYLTARSPYGNPADVEEGPRLLGWYLQNLNCEALCRPKQDPQGCVQACGQGQDPAHYHASRASSPAASGSSPRR